ncbi:sugar transferase [Spirulina sp. CCNP1310]|uniref:sugar transferase n=1 Tax=Spirulina sp. CCNP1310 TaxID=3110249 RepID=UPI002B20D7EA|nr:sugar transferase [Spirulina sp. CCNP1310]MEA5419409.1 sugar transferase [Spirulina sp. CCNP1310]
MAFKQHDDSSHSFHRLVPDQRDLRDAHALGFSRGSIFGVLRILLFIILDAGMVILAWIAAKRIPAMIPGLQVVDGFYLLPHSEQHPGFLLPIIVINTGVLVAANLYGPRFQRRSYFSLITKLSLAQAILVMITFLYQPGLNFSRSTFILGWLFTILFVLLARLGAEGLITLLREEGAVRRKIMLVGHGQDMERARLLIELINKKEFDIVAMVSLEALADMEHWQSRLDEVYFQGAGEVFVCSWQSINHPMEFYWSIKSSGLNLRILPIDLEIPAQRPQIEMIGGMPSIVFVPPTLVGSDFLLKRSFDVVMSALILILASPLYVAIALLIRFDSPGKIFYKQQRAGLRGKTIQVWKFRTMVENADQLQALLEAHNQTDGVLFKMKDDPRITKVGKFLRRYSLDEIPQVINVLFGTMSLVGPRPLPLRDVERFQDHHHLRHNVMPGITGLWQVSGRSDITDFDEAFKLDIAYIQNWSLGLDFQILLRTIKVVLGKEGAY